MENELNVESAISAERLLAKKKQEQDLSVAETEGVLSAPPIIDPPLPDDTPRPAEADDVVGDPLHPPVPPRPNVPVAEVPAVAQDPHHVVPPGESTAAEPPHPKPPKVPKPGTLTPIA